MSVNKVRALDEESVWFGANDVGKANVKIERSTHKLTQHSPRATSHRHDNDSVAAAHMHQNCVHFVRFSVC